MVLNLFAIEIPVIGPLKVNVYIVRSTDGDLIIDAGPGLLLSKLMLRRSLSRVKVNLERCSFFVTHSHADHFGLIERFISGSKVYMSRKEADFLVREKNVKELLNFVVENGFPEHEATIIARFMLRGPLRKPLELIPLKNGDVIEIGDYKLKCIETPGHTCGHTCLYDRERKILVSGDHILSDATPNVSSWSYEDDALSAYILSLKKVYQIDAKLVLPGHGRIFTNLKKKVVELMEHYRWRLLEIVKVLSYRSGDAYWLSSKIRWETRHPNWARVLNVLRRWLAFGETLACLNFLVKLGIVERRELRGKVQYSVVDASVVDKLNNYFTRSVMLNA